MLVARPDRSFVQGLILHILIQGTIRVTIFVLQKEYVTRGGVESMCAHTITSNGRVECMIAVVEGVDERNGIGTDVDQEFSDRILQQLALLARKIPILGKVAQIGIDGP